MSKHKKISFVKSGIRIAGYFYVLHWQAGLLLVIAEILGIIEEIGEK